MEDLALKLEVVDNKEWSEFKLNSSFSGVVNEQGLAHLIVSQLGFHYGDTIKTSPLNVINSCVIELNKISAKFARTMCEYFLVFDFPSMYLSDTNLQQQVYNLIHSI